MSAFTEPSSIVLIVGAICIFLFIMHGLWFSGKPQNRQLKQNNQHDQELSKSKHVGKVRIITSDLPDYDESDSLINNSKADDDKANNLKLKKNKEDQHVSSVLVNANKEHKELEIKEVAKNALVNIDENKVNNQLNDSEYIIDKNGTFKVRKMYEIIIVSNADNPFKGADIENICKEYGFIQGYIQDNMKIYCVYEDAVSKNNEVFRICSMEAPYYFPENMQEFTTSAMAVYMNLPPCGKGFAYFKAMRMAANIFINHLGGQLQDNHHQILDNDRLDEMALQLQYYDASLAN